MVSRPSAEDGRQYRTAPPPGTVGAHHHPPWEAAPAAYAEPLIVALEDLAPVAAPMATGDRDRPSRCPDWSVGDVLDHTVGVTRKFTEFASGSTDRSTDDVWEAGLEGAILIIGPDRDLRHSGRVGAGTAPEAGFLA